MVDEHAAERALVLAAFESSVELKRRTVERSADTVVTMAEEIDGSLQRGGKLLTCGNGGSAADAQHLAAELLVRLRPHVDRQPLPAIALAMDTSTLTAHANDYDFDSLFSRMVTALGRPGDVLLAISTSGKSPNIVGALFEARRVGMRTIALLGGTGGDAVQHCDIALVVPSDITARIQETHITIGHCLIELVEDRFLARSRGV